MNDTHYWRGLRNPEFVRNLWLEISMPRLALAPILICVACAIIVWSMAASDAPPGQIARFIAKLATGCFVAATIVWGALEAGNALNGEIKDGTWDHQRMSGLTAWQLSWGKLLGGTIHTWYVGALLLAVAAIAATVAESRSSYSYTYGYSPEYIVLTGIVLVALAVSLQGINMIRILVARGDQTRSSAQGLTMFAFVILCAMCAITLLNLVFDLTRPNWPLIEWWGFEGTWLQFIAFTLAIFAVWTVVGVWQAMRRELLLRNQPWWWLGFLLYLIFWQWGFGNWNTHRDMGKILEMLFGTVFLIWATGYAQLLLERKDAAAWSRFYAACRRHDVPQILHLLPKWVVSAALAILLCIVTSVVALNDSRASFLMPIIAIAFAARDFACILWFHIAPGIRRPGGATFVYVLVAYGLLPLLSKELFMPFTIDPTKSFVSLMALSFGIIQAVIAFTLLYRQGKKLLRNTHQGK